ncbi:MAG: modification methylase [Deltaproteobacteria bacterium RIFOXYA12_FULL_61_11]|nr:MAG: modification methylase [Deltaproteobacteria bacterium RIFOXYA12_FULL_61_11]
MNKHPFREGYDLPLGRDLLLDGKELLAALHDEVIAVGFFDPQYRGILDRQHYGNEGERQRRRVELPQMSTETIASFLAELGRVLIPSGHLFLWLDKFHLCEGTAPWFEGLPLTVVDLVTWDKGKIGMGYRTRRTAEYLLVLQKEPCRAKGAWTRHDIPDVWHEKATAEAHLRHAHPKPIELQRALLLSTTSPGEVVVDPAAGSFSVLEAIKGTNRDFLGCDLVTGTTEVGPRKRGA